MQANVHTPERLAHESQSEYTTRRAQSNAVGRAMRSAGNGGVSSRKQFRDSMRANGTMGKRTRAYVALIAAWASKRITKAAHRDKHGAYTLVGRHPWAGVEGVSGRRIWLGGISAQRGY
jgi:hypothetical protein